MLIRFKKYVNFYRLNALSYVRKFRLYYNTDKAKVAHLTKTIKCNYRWYGSSYGGFYINPGFLNAESVIYSFGIGTDITFDLKCIKKHNCRVFGFDPTPKSIEYIKSIKNNSSFYFYNFGIAIDSRYQKFYLPANPKGISGSLVINETLDKNRSIMVLMRSFKDITGELSHSYIDVIKMDIEGAEYDVLPSILNSGIQVGQILVEFHDRMFETDEFRSKKIVELMAQNDFEIFAVSKSFEEVSFINRNLLLKKV